jgi:hypothetical protein
MSASKELRRVHQNRERQASGVVDTIRRRLQRAEEWAEVAIETPSVSASQSAAADPSSISHARFAALSSRLAQVSAKASADSLGQPACAHDPVHTEIVLRFLTDVRRISDAVAALAIGDCPVEGAGR